MWEFDDTAKTAKVIGYIGNGGTVIVPSSVTGTGETYGGGYSLGTAGITYTVTDIAAHWSYSPDIKSVYLPDTLTSTSAERWFEMMTGLQEVNNLPDTLENMAYTFSGCTSLTIPPEIPDSVSDMTYTFMGCENLAEISNIPASISNMSGCYMDCNALTSLPEILDIAVNMDNTFQNTGITEAPVDWSKGKIISWHFRRLCWALMGKLLYFYL